MKILALLVNLAGLESWAKKRIPSANGVLGSILRRPPLVVLAAGGAPSDALALWIFESGCLRAPFESVWE
jgi:hypothetical protein